MIANLLWREWRRRRGYRLFPLVVLLVAAVVRFYHLDAQSLWNDEGNTLRLIQRSLPNLIAAANRDIHPPGYYLLLKGWSAFTGETEFALRAFSVFAGILSVAAMIALGHRLHAPGVGVLAGLIVALNGFGVYYSQETRMYALLQGVAALALWLFVVWVGRGGRFDRWLVGFAILNAAGLYTHYSYPFVMLAEGMLFVLWWVGWISGRGNRKDARSVSAFTPLMMFIGANVLTLALFAPQAPAAIQQITGWNQVGRSVDTGGGLGMALQWLTLGSTYPPRETPSVYGWVVVFALAGALPDWLRRPHLPHWWRRLFPIMTLIVILSVFFALGLFREANLKFLLPAQLAFALLIGRGIWLLWEIGSPSPALPLEMIPRLMAGFGLLALANAYGVGLTNLYTNPAYARDDYRRMAALIAAEGRPGDAVILDAPNQTEVFTYYYRGDLPLYPLPVGLGGDDAATEREVRAVIAAHQRLFVLYWGEGERDPNRVVEKMLGSLTFEIDSAWYGDVRFVRYAALPTILEQAPVDARFGESIRLLRAGVSERTVRGGSVLGVGLTWTTDSPLTKRYRVTVQLLRPDGTILAQRDGEPGNNMALTTLWQAGVEVADSHGLIIPPGTPPNEYRLIVAVYDLEPPYARLPAVGGGDMVTLGIIEVQGE
ncbi:MAG TPA: glycosyltransferase family 39 protein [Aggregatilineales bacterium]|nr:glycosyltransferase family 39 protein [Aggregatilineales bacterium]